MPYGMKPKKMVCKGGMVEVVRVDPVTRQPRVRVITCPKCKGKGCGKRT